MSSIGRHFLKKNTFFQKLVLDFLARYASTPRTVQYRTATATATTTDTAMPPPLAVAAAGAVTVGVSVKSFAGTLHDEEHRHRKAETEGFHTDCSRSRLSCMARSHDMGWLRQFGVGELSPSLKTNTFLCIFVLRLNWVGVVCICPFAMGSTFVLMVPGGVSCNFHPMIDLFMG